MHGNGEKTQCNLVLTGRKMICRIEQVKDQMDSTKLIPWQKALSLVIHWYCHLFLKRENSGHDYPWSLARLWLSFQWQTQPVAASDRTAATITTSLLRWVFNLILFFRKTQLLMSVHWKLALKKNINESLCSHHNMNKCGKNFTW